MGTLSVRVHNLPALYKESVIKRNDINVTVHLASPRIQKICKSRDNICKSHNTNVCTMRILNETVEYKDFENECYLFLSNMCDQPGEEYYIFTDDTCQNYHKANITTEIKYEHSNKNANEYDDRKEISDKSIKTNAENEQRDKIEQHNDGRDRHSGISDGHMKEMKESNNEAKERPTNTRENQKNTKVNKENKKGRQEDTQESQKNTRVELEDAKEKQKPQGENQNDTKERPKNIKQRPEDLHDVQEYLTKLFKATNGREKDAKLSQENTEILQNNGKEIQHTPVEIRAPKKTGAYDDNISYGTQKHSESIEPTQPPHWNSALKFIGSDKIYVKPINSKDQEVSDRTSLLTKIKNKDDLVRHKGDITTIVHFRTKNNTNSEFRRRKMNKDDPKSYEKSKANSNATNKDSLNEKSEENPKEKSKENSNEKSKENSNEKNKENSNEKNNENSSKKSKENSSEKSKENSDEKSSKNGKDNSNATRSESGTREEKTILRAGKEKSKKDDKKKTDKKRKDDKTKKDEKNKIDDKKKKDDEKKKQDAKKKEDENKKLKQNKKDDKKKGKNDKTEKDKKDTKTKTVEKTGRTNHEMTKREGDDKKPPSNDGFKPIYDIEETFDGRICPLDCPKAYNPVCITANRGYGLYLKYLTFVNQCTAYQYYCKNWRIFGPPPKSVAEEEEENVDASPLSWSFCGSSRYLSFARFAEVASSMGYYGWLAGDYKATHIMEPRERIPGYGRKK
ncbi:cylicin-2-like [Hyposmocoma kahamanoa]|uniref:cylicin-2-like n=1 Tax=Hyposmocoma kahamanoa TaxID=1477025 RepID=UPI000E6DA57B|nr:cylicin-2-like [Hyposmocoma kahamanoa]